MKITRITIGILTTIIFFGVFLLQHNFNTCATDKQCPVDIQILYSEEGWCSGQDIEISNDYTSIFEWDIITISSVRLGIANLDTVDHSLNQILLTIEEIIDDDELSISISDNLTSIVDFPLILSPQRYWSYDFNYGYQSYGRQCQSITKFSLEVDGEWYEFMSYQLLRDAGIYVDSTYWPPHWSGVVYYTNSQSTPVSFSGISPSIGLILIIYLFHRHRKKK
ncbi:MAG: hypothetical protein ACFFDT_11430 [Candidatus Hodarchaeota archaeon]